jgi:hypothetical protein
METEDVPFRFCRKSEEHASKSSFGPIPIACGEPWRALAISSRSSLYAGPWSEMAAEARLGSIHGIVSASSQALPTNGTAFRLRYLEVMMTVYRAYIVGLHDRSIGVVQMDCIDDNSAIKSATRLVDSHDVELWQMDRPVARFDARSKQILRK